GLPSAWSACPRVVAYEGALGGACNADGECAAGDGHCVDQICRPHAAIGQPCAQEACEQGAFCNTSNVCQALGALGAACELDTDCKIGLACGGKKTCHAPAGPGQPCTNGEVCGAGTTCKNGSCQPSATTCTGLSECGAPSIMTCGHQFSGACEPLL